MHNTSMSSKLFSNVHAARSLHYCGRAYESRMHLSLNRAYNHPQYKRCTDRESRIYYAIGINNSSCVHVERYLPRYRIKHYAARIIARRTDCCRENALKFHPCYGYSTIETVARCVASLQSS